MKKYFLTIVVLFALIVYPSKVFAADTTTWQTQLMTYLPYILIGGAVILLISIVGILLSKKKESTEGINTQAASSQTETVTPVETMTQTPPPSVNMDNISENLYTPAVAMPTIQETIESNTPVEEQPISQQEFTPTPVPVTAQQSSDLQDIMQGEASAAPMGPVTDHIMEETPMMTATPVSEPVPTSEPMSSIMPDATQTDTVSTASQETPVVADVAPVSEPFAPTITETAQEIPTTTVPDLQQFVNNQVAEVPPMAAPMETPAPAVTQDFNAAPTDTATPTQTGAPFSI